MAMCSNRRYFFNGFCYDSCPAEYMPNPDATTCVRLTSTTNPCRSGEYFYAGICLGQCVPGTYPQGFNCVGCENNCMTCASPTTCADCAPGYYLVAGKCLLSAVCSAPQLSLGQNCVNSCPEGTYVSGASCLAHCSEGLFYHNGLCYPRCMGGFVSNGYGCVASCPSGQNVVDGICVGQGSGCGSGLYFDTARRECLPCLYPCGTCIGNANICTSCLSGTLSNGRCHNSGGSGGISGTSLIVTATSSITYGTTLEL